MLPSPHVMFQKQNNNVVAHTMLYLLAEKTKPMDNIPARQHGFSAIFHILSSFTFCLSSHFSSHAYPKASNIIHGMSLKGYNNSLCKIQTEHELSSFQYVLQNVCSHAFFGCARFIISKLSRPNI